MARLTPQQRERALKALRSGKSAKEVAEKYGVASSSMSRLAKRHGIDLAYPYNGAGVPVDKDEIVKMRKRKSRVTGRAKWTHSDIADVMGCSRNYVSTVLRERGID